jgi:leucyl-tRNA synthetase
VNCVKVLLLSIISVQKLKKKAFADQKDLNNKFKKIKQTNLFQKVPMKVTEESGEYRRCVADLCVMLAPMTPCFASELWQGLASVCRGDPRLHQCFVS